MSESPKILNLGPLTIDDGNNGVEAQYEKDLMDNAYDVPDYIDVKELLPVYDNSNKIPNKFTSLKLWPLTTNLCCWSCHNTFKTRPCFVPMYISENNISVEGNFCSFPCASLYIDVHYPNSYINNKHNQLKQNLCILFNIFNGYKVTNIPPALSITLLKTYGGPYDIAQFKKINMEKIPPQPDITKLKEPNKCENVWSYYSKDHDHDNNKDVQLDNDNDKEEPNHDDITWDDLI